MAMAGAGVGDWAFSADSSADSSAIFAELGCWAAGLDEGLLLPPLDPPPPAGSASVDGGASSSSTDDGAAQEDAADDLKPAAETMLAESEQAAAPASGKKLQGEAKKKKERARQARFAFMTRSETEHLEDGYRWRKYGQKAVKNSPFPRSYYRCTNARCTVKKRVERSSDDPAVVVTTYEGQHSHHAAVSFPRALMAAFDFSYSSTMPPPPPPHDPLAALLLPHCDHRQDLQAASVLYPLSTTSARSTPSPMTTTTGGVPAVDRGLLDDMVPPAMRHGRTAT